MGYDEYFYPREDRIPEEEDDSTNNKKKRLRISRVVTAPQEGDEYEIDDDDNHKKSKPIIDIEKITEDTRKEIEDMFRKERDYIMSKDQFKDLKPVDYEKKKDAISRFLENTIYRKLLEETIHKRINEHKRYQRQLLTKFGFSKKEEPMDPNESPSNSSSSSLTPSSSPSLASSLSSSPYPLKGILKRKREGGRRTKKAKKSKAKKSKAKKSRSRK